MKKRLPNLCLCARAHPRLESELLCAILSFYIIDLGLALM